MSNWVPPCFSGRPSGERTGRRISTGALSRTGVWTAVGWCSVMSYTSARSILLRLKLGAGRSRCSTRTPARPVRCRCFPMSVAIFPPPTPRSCVCGSARCGSAGRASGAPAGSPAFCGANCNSTASGPIACQEAAKGRAGPTCCKCWRRIASFHPAASGGCIANGSSIAPWPICSAPTSALRKRTSSTPVTTSSSPTNRRCSHI